MHTLDLIFIVDDDPIFVFTTQKILERIGCCKDIVVCNNGFDAINEFKSRLQLGQPIPELICLDLNMPVMNGWEFLEELEQLENKDTTVGIFSSSIDPNDIEKSKKHEVVKGYFKKPFTIEDIQGLLLGIKRG